MFGCVRSLSSEISSSTDWRSPFIAFFLTTLTATSIAPLLSGFVHVAYEQQPSMSEASRGDQ